jgi:hypothetical protein
VKHEGGSVIIWAAISGYCAGPIITLNGPIIASDYVDILVNQLHPKVQMLFPKNDAVFQDDNLLIHTARSFQSWFEEHEDKLQYLSRLAQSPDSNIIEPLQVSLGEKCAKQIPSSVTSQATS